MKHARSPVISIVGLLAFLIGMVCTAAYADDYSDVSQMVRAGKLPEALIRADQYLATQPKDPQMRFIKGVIQRDSGKTAEAIATFTKLTEDYPELPEPYNNLAVLYAGQSQFDKARAALEMAIRTNPSYSTAHENLGDIYAKLASQAYNKALQLDTGNAAVPTKLALIREIFNNGSAKGSRPGPIAQQVAPTATPAIKPPVVAVAPVAPTTPPASVQPKPMAPTPAAPAVSTLPPVPAPTPPIATKTPVENTAPVANPSASSAQAKDVEAAVGKWAAAWSARDVKAYLAAYGKDFDPPGSMGRKAWEEERTQRILGKSSISVKVDKLDVSVNGNYALAKFRQDYKAGGLVVSSRKTLTFSKVGEQWHIVKESVGN
jgi:tetratricopeptide (TPR) repeat protein